jgi:nucleoside-diphosphate-sugar epimerase
LVHREDGLPCIILRTSRFFPEDDDNRATRDRYENDNLKVNEFLHRRADLEDVVTAHLAAITKAPELRFDRFIVSATTPFTTHDLSELRTRAPSVMRRYCPDYEAEYVKRGWTAPDSVDRVYVNQRARMLLAWQPRYDFSHVVQQLRAGQDYGSPLARAVGSKGYHSNSFDEGPYPVG